MDQIHLSPLVDQIQLALGYIFNSLPLALESTIVGDSPRGPLKQRGNCNNPGN
jgi:hypothetical protein